jgi:Uma2 family endonuclease
VGSPSSRIRKPDVSFFRFGRLPGERIPKGNITLAPNLAAEVVSPNDLYYEEEEKINEYFDAGVNLVGIVNPDTRTVHVYRPDGSAVRLTEDGQLAGGDLLPGFRCRVRDLFPTPATTADAATSGS